MKRFRRMLSVVTVVLMLTAAFVSMAVASAENEIYVKRIENSYADSSLCENSRAGSRMLFSRAVFDGCYGNQLSGVARELYDSMKKSFVTDAKTSAYSYTFKAPFTFKAAISGGSIVTNDELREVQQELDFSAQAALDAFLYDYPQVYWLKIIGTSYSIYASGNPVSGYTGIIKDIEIIPTEIYSGASAKASQYKSALNAALKDIEATESRYETLKNVHDYICDNAWYNLVSEQRVHTSEPFFIGDGGVVCEGYAETFKVICDRLDIPCVLVSGDAGGAHMWNYVQMDDGKWYLVDVTWDDQQSRIYDTYFLANANTVGFDGVAISKERTERNDFSGTGVFSFTYPVLSTTAYTVHTHTWVSETCTTPKTCSGCGITEGKALGHDFYISETTKQPTCLENGIEIHSCRRCSYRSEWIVGSYGHRSDGNTVIIEPTCTLDGATIYCCAICGDNYSEPISKTGHRNKTVYYCKQPTCTEDGYTDGEYCNDCKSWVEGHSVLSATGHKSSVGVITKSPSCIETGLREYRCLVCETVTSTEVISPNGHSYIYHSEKTPTCTNFGWQEYETCGRCTYTTYNEIPATGHIDKNKDDFCEVCHEYLKECSSKLIEKGDCGTDAEYKFYEDGTLLISGTGKIENSYTFDLLPWYSYNKDIKKVIIENGITEIAEYSFLHCYYLTDIIIPESIEIICSYAFQYCTSLKQIALPKSIVGIGEGAFNGCESLEDIILPDGLKHIRSGTFFSCDNLKYVSMSKNIITIEKNAFGLCNNLTDIYYTGSQKEWSEIFIDECNEKLGSITVHFRWGHSDVPKTIKESSCFEPGLIRYTCTICYDHYDEETEKLPHTPATAVIENRAEPKCEMKGSYDEAIYCSVCDTELSRTKKEIPALTHSWNQGEITTASTCKTQGTKTYTCLNDASHKKTEQVPLDASNHEGGTYLKNTAAATCTADGYSGDVHCKGCDKKLEAGNVIPATDHANKTEHAQQDSTCTEIGYTAGVYCPDCKKWLSGHGEIPELPHAYETVTVPASFTDDGMTQSECSCGDVEFSISIPKLSSVKLSTASCTYNGKTRSPSVSVTDSAGNALVNGTDYDVTIPSGRKNPGVYEYKISFKGNYEGEKTLTFTILPKAPAKISATQSTSVIKLSWSESVGATGYRVYQYSPSKGKYVQIASVKGVTSYRKATNLKPGTEYSFKIKPYTKLSDGTVLWGTASEAFTTATECKAPAITSVTSASKSKATVKWSDVSGETGYQLYYSTSKNGTYKKVNSYAADKLAGSKTFSSSSSGKTIYFKVRAYKKVAGQTIFSEWSAVKSVKLK